MPMAGYAMLCMRVISRVCFVFVLWCVQPDVLV